MVLGKDEGEMEDERKPPADGGCEEFVAPVIWNGKPADY